MRTHDRSHFYKYTSADTALRVVSSHSLRWSSPIKFNDPFDHQIGFSFAFSGEELGEALNEEMEKIVFGGKTSFRQPSLFSLLAMKLSAAKDRLPREAVMADFAEASREVAGNLDGHIRKLHDEVQRHLTHSRVLCVTEKHDNVVMWSHYADEHRGVVFELRCIGEIDNTLLAARKVRYSKNFPSFPSLARYVRHLTGEEPLDLVRLSWDIAYTKHEDWSYENEWRVHMPLLQEPPGEGFSLLSEHPQVFGNVYLGCRMEETERTRIIAAVRKHLPHSKLLVGKKSTSSFSLEFEELAVA